MTIPTIDEMRALSDASGACAGYDCVCGLPVCVYAKFIAAAREFVPSAISEIERWKSKWEDLECSRASCCDDNEQEAIRLRAENEKLRDGLQHMDFCRDCGDGPACEIFDEMMSGVEWRPVVKEPVA